MQIDIRKSKVKRWFKLEVYIRPSDEIVIFIVVGWFGGS